MSVQPRKLTPRASAFELIRAGRAALQLIQRPFRAESQTGAWRAREFLEMNKPSSPAKVGVRLPLA